MTTVVTVAVVWLLGSIPVALWLGRRLEAVSDARAGRAHLKRQHDRP